MLENLINRKWWKYGDTLCIREYEKLTRSPSVDARRVPFENSGIPR